MSDLITVPIRRTQQGHRAFSMAYKIEFLRRWDACIERSAKSRQLRENNLTSTMVRAWIKARDAGHLQEIPQAFMSAREYALWLERTALS
ncbi:MULTISPECIES: hypothetical protein [unclassified Rhodococcus (in: high G+C Gram-positive bacteria)]|uniref:hypothetical protein n=1 Tax=Rhodococcus sp. SJ-3 TaxID=3454628 RepID=UPI003F7942A8